MPDALPTLYTPAVLANGALVFGDCRCVCVPRLTASLRSIIGAPSTPGLNVDSLAFFAWYEKNPPNPWTKKTMEVRGVGGASDSATLGGMRKKDPCGVPVDVTDATASVLAATDSSFAFESASANIVGVQSGGWAFEQKIMLARSFAAQEDVSTVVHGFRFALGATNSCTRYYVEWYADATDTAAEPVLPLVGTATIGPSAAARDVDFTVSATIPAYDPTGPDEQRHTRYFWAKTRLYLDPNYDQGLANQ